MTAAHEITRISAFVAFVAYTIATAWGIALTRRAFTPPVRPQLDYHRFVAAIGAVALVVHVATVVLSHANNVQVEALVYVRARPAAVAGVTSFWLALALPLTFRLRGRGLSTGAWRALHYLAYAVWALALLHGLGAGTDTRATHGLLLYGGSAAVVGAAAWWRLLQAPVPAPAPPPAAAPAPADAG